MSVVFVCLVLLFNYPGQLHSSQATGSSTTRRDSSHGIRGGGAEQKGGDDLVTHNEFADHMRWSQKENDSEDVVFRNAANDVEIVEREQDGSRDSARGREDAQHEDEDDFYFGAFFYTVGSSSCPRLLLRMHDTFYRFKCVRYRWNIGSFIPFCISSFVYLTASWGEVRGQHICDHTGHCLAPCHLQRRPARQSVRNYTRVSSED